MKRLILALILTASLVGQVEHAPTVAQCQADQRLWISRIEEGDSPRLPVFTVLTQWSHEMMECEKVDPNNEQRYYNTGSEIDEVESNRLLGFLNRHDLYHEVS
jgi:hypothetical protein